MVLTPYTTHTGIAAALLRENIDTDVIIPSREITSPGREGFGAKAFAPWRYLARADGAAGASPAENPEFVLNRKPWRQASILIAGANFGCGSSREMAVWAIAQFGFKVLIAPSFGAIFRLNCVRNALLPIELPLSQVRALASVAESEQPTLTVDLTTQTISAADLAPLPFAIDAHERETLLSGLDATARTLQQQRQAITAFEARDRRERPWVWLAAR